MESPPYSPLEPKSLNLNAFQSLDLTRPDLKVTTPKGYTPNLTTRSVVSGVTSVTTSIAKTASPIERKSTLTQSSTKSKSESSRSSKKDKEKKDPKNSKKTDSPRSSLLSPASSVKSNDSPKSSKKTKSPSSPAVSLKEKEKQKEQREKEREKDREKQKEREKERERQKELEKEKEREKEKAREKELESAREREREREREKDAENEIEKIIKQEDEVDVFKERSPSPFILHGRDSPSSSLFSPPRMRIASYQSDKKKPMSKEKSKEKKEEKERNREEKKSKHKKKSNALSSPSSVGSSPKLKSPSSKSDILSPPRQLSQPIIKLDRATIKTVMFPPDSSSDNNSSPRTKHSEHTTESPGKRDGGVTVKHEPENEKPTLKIDPIQSSMQTSHKHSGVKKENVSHPTDVSESDIDVTTLSQGEEASYTGNFQPNMFFPSKFGDDKKKKKKKKSEKDRDEKIRKVCKYMHATSTRC